MYVFRFKILIMFYTNKLEHTPTLPQSHMLTHTYKLKTYPHTDTHNTTNHTLSYRPIPTHTHTHTHLHTHPHLHTESHTTTSAST